MRERTVEKHLKRKVESLGGLCLKWTSPGIRGVPDRIIIWPGGRVHFAELKAPGKKLSPAQARFARLLTAKRCEVLCLASKEDVDIYIAACAKVFRL